MEPNLPNRKRYPQKISIVGITNDTRERLNDYLRQHPSKTEAEIVRTALDAYLAMTTK